MRQPVHCQQNILYIHCADRDTHKCWHHIVDFIILVCCASYIVVASRVSMVVDVDTTCMSRGIFSGLHTGFDIAHSAHTRGKTKTCAFAVMSHVVSCDCTYSFQFLLN